MNEKPIDSNHEEHPKTWLERLSHALLREPQDREQLVELLRDAEQRQLLDSNALTMIEGVLQVSVMQVRDIMIPRSQMVVIDIDMDLEAILPVVIESAHSRFPVTGENRDDVLGILLAKDLLEAAQAKESQKFILRNLLRPAVFVPESKRLNTLLQEFRRNRNHMAMVADEYGGVAGLVTIEDVLEQIVGEIEDEHDIDEEDHIKKHSETEYTIKALIPIEDFNEYFHTELPKDDYDTLGGLVLQQFGHLPKRDETTVIGPYTFKVLHADQRRIHLLQMVITGE